MTKGISLPLGLASAAVFFERLAYYSMRAVLVFFMIEALSMPRGDVFKMYGMFTAFIFTLPLIGAVIADFIIGRKLSSCIGLLLCAAGVILLPGGNKSNIMGILLLIALGNALFKPAFYALFGELFYTKNENQAMAGYTGMFLLINLGAFMGPYTVEFLSGTKAYTAGLYIAAFAFALAFIFMVCFSLMTGGMTKKVTLPHLQIIAVRKVSVPIVLFLMTVYAVLFMPGEYIMSGPMIRELELGFRFYMVNPLAVIVFSLILIPVLIFNKMSGFTKLAIGLAALIAGAGLAYASFDQNTAMPVLLLLALAEAVIVPFVFTYVSRISPASGTSVFFALLTLTGLLTSSILNKSIGMELNILIIALPLAVIALVLAIVFKKYITAENQ